MEAHWHRRIKPFTYQVDLLLVVNCYFFSIFYITTLVCSVVAVTWAVHYTDCITAEGYDHSTKECTGYKASGKTEYFFIAITSKSTLTGMEVTERFLFMG